MFACVREYLLFCSHFPAVVLRVFFKFVLPTGIINQNIIIIIILDQYSQVVGEVYAQPLTLAQHDNQLVLTYSPLYSTVATENAGAEIQLQPLSNTNVVHSEAAIPCGDNDAVVFSSSDADDDNVFDVDYVPDSAESCSSEISIENSIKHFLPLSNSNTHATDHSVPYSSGGNNVDSGECNGSDDMNACNSTDCKQKTEGDSQSSLTTSVEKLKAITAATIANMPGKRCCDKRYFCLFCDKPQAKLKTHLISQHSSELEVAEMTAKKDLKSQNLILHRLRNLGNHKHNCDVIRSGSGTLVVTYRPKNGGTDPDNYAPCPSCYGYYETHRMWKHCKYRCPLGPKVPGPGRVLSQARYLLPAPLQVTDNTKKVISMMVKDSVYRAAVNDEVIMKYADKLTLKHFADQDKHEYVRAKIRELGRLLNVLKADHDIQSIADAIDPCRFRNVLQSVRRVAGFVGTTGQYATPSLALKLGYALKKCATILQSKGLQESDKELEKKADGFNELCDIEWSNDCCFRLHLNDY